MKLIEIKETNKDLKSKVILFRTIFRADLLLLFCIVFIGNKEHICIGKQANQCPLHYVESQKSARISGSLCWVNIRMRLYFYMVTTETSPARSASKILLTSPASSVCPSAHISFVTAASVVISRPGITPHSKSFLPTS